MELISEFDDKMVKKKEEIVEEENDFSQNPERQVGDVVPELDLSVSQLDGVGAVTQKKLETFGVTNLIDICVRGAREVSEITRVAKPTVHCRPTAKQPLPSTSSRGRRRGSDKWCP